MENTQKYSWFHLALFVLVFLLVGTYLVLSIFVRTTALTGAAADATSHFTDIKPQTYDAIVTTELYKLGAFTGYPDGSFGLYTTLNRAEVAKILVQAANIPIFHSSSDVPFKDVTATDWFADHVSTVKVQGIVNGYPDGTYKPANTISRVEFMKMLSETFTLDKNVGYSFRDVNGAAWYAQYLGWYEQQGIFFPPMLMPERPITRLEAARAMYAAIKLGTSIGANQNVPNQNTVVTPMPSPQNVSSQNNVVTPVPPQNQGTQNVPVETDPFSEFSPDTTDPFDFLGGDPMSDFTLPDSEFGDASSSHSIVIPQPPVQSSSSSVPPVEDIDFEDFNFDDFDFDFDF